SLSISGCSVKAKSDDNPTNNSGDQNPGERDLSLVGSWTNSQDQSGMSVESKFSANTLGQGSQSIKLNGDLFVDLDFAAQTSVNAGLKRLLMTVTFVRVDQSDEPIAVGEQVKCIYENLTSSTVKIDCAEKNQDFPGSFSTDAIVYTKD
ncbi:MAG: hypothetical protein NT027_02970, partial [Proteobacteria bacterium]|nr:hypothetical protein [Pseudomonadota bacterium]